MTVSYVVDDSGEGQRVDAWLSSTLQVSRSEAQRLIGRGLVSVNGLPAAKSTILRRGLSVDIQDPPPPLTSAPVEAAYTLIFEDDHLAVISKPAGVVVHPAPGARSATLVQALARHMALAPAGGSDRPGVVHRLDKDTSGLLVVAKTDEALSELARSLKAREVERTYRGLTQGNFSMPSGRIEAPVGRSERDRTRMNVTGKGREAITEFTVERSLPDCDLLVLRILTGRTHQIRVHMEHVGHPIVGDSVYGKSTLALARTLGLKRPFLHASALQFLHPISGAEMFFEDELPADLDSALQRAGSS